MAISTCIKALGLALGLLATVSAQAISTATTPSGSSPSSTSSAPIVTHTVAVAADGFRYDPDQITANVSDIILFVFYQGNHSVARAEYGHPCIPYENLGGGRVGFWSGFEPVKGIPDGNGPTFSLRINSTEPVFFYCSAPGACVPNGMIGVVNPNATQTLDNQALFVKNASFQLTPGEAPPPESSASATSDSSYPASTSDADAGSYSTGDGGGGISKGAIAGIVVGAVVVIALAGLTFYLCGRNRTLASVVRYSQPPRPKHPSSVPTIGSMPYSPSSQHTDPYAASPGFKAVTPVPGAQENWHLQQPSMAENRSISPGFPSPYSTSGHSPGHAPWSPGGFTGQQYSQVPHQEMSTGYEHNVVGTPQHSPGFHPHDSYLSATSHMSHTPLTSPTSYTHPQEQEPVHQPAPVVHEMDAAPTDSPTGPPPEYAGRPFSFAEGIQAEAPGVEKVLR